MRKTFSWKNLSCSLLLLLSGCATPVPDVPVCVELTPDEGYCVDVISGKDFKINEQTKFEDKNWWDMRPEMVQVPPSSWAKIKAFIIKVCKVSKSCQKEVSSWDQSIKKVDDTLQIKTGK